MLIAERVIRERVMIQASRTLQQMTVVELMTWDEQKQSVNAFSDLASSDFVSRLFAVVTNDPGVIHEGKRGSRLRWHSVKRTECNGCKSESDSDASKRHQVCRISAGKDPRETWSGSLMS